MSKLNLAGFTDILSDEIPDSQESQPLSLTYEELHPNEVCGTAVSNVASIQRPAKGTGQHGQFRCVDEIDVKYRSVFSYPYFNLVQSSVIEDAIYSDKSMVICAPTGSGKTVVFEMAIVQLLMEIEDTNYTDDFKIIYMAPVKALCTERLTEWYPKFTKLGLMCIEVTGDTDVDFSQLKPYRIIITTPEKWDMVTRRWREHRQLVEVIKLFLIDEVHILNDETRGPVLEAVVSRMKTIESSAQSAHRIEQLQNKYQGKEVTESKEPPKIRFVAVSATVSNPQDVAAWLGSTNRPAVYYKFGDESRPVKLKRVVEGYPCPEGMSIFKFDIILNYKLWPIIQKYHNGKPTLIFCNTRKSVALTAETLSRDLTVSFTPEQKAKLTAVASTIKNKKLQALVLSGVGCHHAGLLFEERTNIERAFRNRDLPILITTTTLAMGVNLPAHLVIIKNTQQYVNGAYQEYSISTILQMVGRAGRPQFDTEATAVIMTRLSDKHRYQALVGGNEPLQSYLHKRLAENLNSEAALGTVNDVAQCVQWLGSTFLYVRAAKDPKRYLGLPPTAPQQLISKKIEELCIKAMNGLATSGLISMDEASCIESTEAGRLMSIYYLDLETMRHIMKINGTETLERLLWVICESHELADMHLRVDERRCLNTLNRNNAAATIRFPMKGKISTRQMKLNCIIQAVLGCLNIPDPSLNQEAMKIMRIAARVGKCLVAYITRPALIAQKPQYYSAILNGLILKKCVTAHMWENSRFVSKQLKGIGPTFSTLLATAGKVTFALLEESHPRDLERIMNKGPPAGNVIRKQISLLPKYQLTLTPVDDRTVTVQLVLLNQNYMSENMEQLTAGESHKSYIVVGNSENDLLLLSSFKDKDLIGVYNGTITHQINRKHGFEHKTFAHVISSSFVGIDAESEYLFKSIEPVCSSHLTSNLEIITKPANKQTTITDTFKEHKRKTLTEDITQSKEKKKQDNALFEKFKNLEQSFRQTSKELKEDLNKSAIMSNQTLKNLTHLDKPVQREESALKQVAEMDPLKIMAVDDSSTQGFNETSFIESNEFLDDEKINSLLNEIENEMSKGNDVTIDLPQVDLYPTKNKQNLQNRLTTKLFPSKPYVRNDNSYQSCASYNNSNNRSKKATKSNYNFIELLEKNLNLSDDEEPILEKNCGFSDAVKNQIEKYLEQTKRILKVPDKSITDLLEVSTKNKKIDNQLVLAVNTKFETQDNIHDTRKLSAPVVNEHFKNNILENDQKSIEEQSDSIEQCKETVNETGLNERIVINNNNILGDDINANTGLNKDTHNDTHTGTINNKRDHNNLIAESNINKFNDTTLENIDLHFDTVDLSSCVNENHVFIDLVSSEQKDIKNERISSIKHLKKINRSDLDCCAIKITKNKLCFPNIEPAAFQNISFSEIDSDFESNTHNKDFKIQNLISTNNAFQLVPVKKTSLNNHQNINSNLTSKVETIPGPIVLNYDVKDINSHSAAGHSLNTSVHHTTPYVVYSTKENPLKESPNTKSVNKNIVALPYTQTSPVICHQNPRKSLMYRYINTNRRPQRQIPYTNSEQGNSNSSQNFYTSANNQNVNIKQFSYSSSRIDVATKSANLHVIRQIKMDLNIQVHTTEITQEDEEVRLNEVKCLKQNDVNNYKTAIQEKSATDQEKWYTAHELISLKYPLPSIKNTEIHDLEAQSLTILRNEETTSNHNVRAQKKQIPTATLKKMNTPLQSLNYNQTEDATLESNEVKNYNVDNTMVITKDPHTKSNEIENIFSKYSKRLRKSNAGHFSQNISLNKTTKDSRLSNTSEKAKKPFKITDINTLSNPLPKYLIDETAARKNKYDEIGGTPNRETFTEVQHSRYKEELTHEAETEPILHIDPEPKIWENFTDKSHITNAEIENIDEKFEFELLEHEIDDIGELVPIQAEAEFNIDQTMLNPKTLLQCFSDEPDDSNIILPPPIEFCDDRESTPSKTTSNYDLTDYEPIHWESFHDSNEANENIFGSDSQIQLTPRKEIETWTLSQHNTYQNITAPVVSPRCVTIMHKSEKRNCSNQNASVARPSLETTQSRLGQFKFCRKRKLPKE